MTDRDVMQQALEALMTTNFEYHAYAAAALREALAKPAQRKPLTYEQIMAIGKQLGLKCKLGGNPNIDFDYARAIEQAHGITGEAK